MSEDGVMPPVAPVTESADNSVPQSMTPGTQMSRERQARGWSVADVANQLNLAPRQIQAIEDDNLAALPGTASARGFVRAYAKLLKIDPVPLLAMMPADAVAASHAMPARRAMAPAHFSDTRLTSSNHHRISSGWYSVLLLVVVGTGIGVAAQRFGMLPPDLESALAKASSVFASIRPQVAEQATESTPTVTENVDVVPEPERKPLVSPVAVPAPAVTVPSVAAPLAVTPTAPLSTPAAASTADANNNQLVLNLRADSWIEVRGTGKSAVASKLYHAGTTETFTISEPVTLVVGNASGVDATLRGQPLPLQSAAKNNVARISVK
ncbi:cytoskeleton protein RodZ [Actimicrobium sp. GrIS 1.19]|uniref:RodZ domain-containing protein n=1 Tax=Actimicrobium sp. GrIS 1.19 TaxID=3071708 RepID=UPI002E074EC4|nr:cytoskeleton protein RodZ [Actimicrobium sp. GrIS 1.19]